MEILDFVLIAVIALAIGGAVVYLVRAKKRGQQCVGCPYSGSCHSCPSKKGD